PKQNCPAFLMKTNWLKKVSIYTIECIFWQRLFSQRKGESNKEASEDASTGRGQSPRERKFPPPSIDHPWGRLSAGWSCETAALPRTISWILESTDI
ncbi:hypothetical protein AVEN_223219-1, partial [Araneus ventricosus]